MKIHSTAVIHPNAKLAPDVEIGPHSVIGEHVAIGDGSSVGAHCVLDGYTTIGTNNHFYTGAVIGSIPQNLKYKGEKTFLEIGNNNNFREYVTVNCGTVEGGGTTRIGNDVHIMTYSHIAHDCVVHDGVIIANNGTLGGHVEIGERAILGGLAGVHQFVRIGRLSIVGGHSKATQDVLPFVTVDGHPARVYGLNLIGLKRAGISKEIQHALKQALQILFRSSFSRKEALEEIRRQCGPSAEVKEFVDFIERSERGICTRARLQTEEPVWND